MNNSELGAALHIAFEAGRWLGQVDLEEHFDNNQKADSILESLTSRKIAMPTEKENITRIIKLDSGKNVIISSERPVMINLRSDKWRDGVKKSAFEYLEKAKNI